LSGTYGNWQVSTTTSSRAPVDSRDVADLKAWERWIAHAGYIAEGLLYLLIGTFALLATLDTTRRANGTQGVLIRLSLTAPRKLLLAAVALGLASFVTWQLLVAIRDPEHRRDRDRRVRALIRIEHLFSAALHSVLVIEATKILFGFGRNASSERTQQEWIARAFGAPLGRYVVGAVGVGILFYGLYQCYRAVTRNRDSRVNLTRTRLRPILDVLGVFGLLSRGAMFSLIGIYLIRAAWQLHAEYALGVAGALGSLRQQPYGGWALGTMAAGLLSYGLWQIVKEPYRRLRDS
jgi:hypothetical protein